MGDGHLPKGSVFLSTRLTPELEAEGFARELIRRAQQLRKEAGLQKNDRISLWIDAPELADAVKRFEKEIGERVGANSVTFGSVDSCDETSSTKIKGKHASLGLKKA
jgi:isoleucyl-tRNA synthetase